MPRAKTLEHKWVANLENNIFEKILQLKQSGKVLRGLSTDQKNRVLENLADLLDKNRIQVLEANAIDLKQLPNETTSAFKDRLTLTDSRINGMILSVQQISKFPDPVGELISSKKLENGLLLKKVRSPIGTILMVFEARPNVITEVFSLAFKSGNTLALRGGSDSKNTSSLLYKLIHQSIAKVVSNFEPFYGFTDYDRSLIAKLLNRADLIDVVIPRGGEKLIQFVQENARMPIIKNDRGMCHAYVDASADISMAVEIVKNAKTQRPGVCNSLETVLVHQSVANEFLVKLYAATKSFNLKWNADSKTLQILANSENVNLATDECWDIESLDYVLNCKIVTNIDEAVSHIEKHSSKHSEVIVTQDEALARKFQNDIDSAAVYWNASTRFTDGFEFGLGGELGISTQKLHVRGPVGLVELTTPRWLIDGHGQIRES